MPAARMQQSKVLNSGGGAPAPAWNQYMFATQWNVVNNSKTTAPANKGGYISRSAHFVGSKPLLKMRFIWINRHIGSSSTGMGTAPGNAFPLTDASAEYNGVTYPIPFSSLRSVTIGDGLAVYSDILDVPTVMGTPKLAVDDRIDVKFKGLVTPGQFVEASAPRGNTVISGQQIYFYDPTKVVMGSTDDPGPYTWTYQNGGTATDLAQNSSGWVPFVIGVHESAPDVWMAFGDSMTANTGDTGMNTSGTGWFQRVLGMFPTKGAGLNFSVHGSTGRAGLDDPVFTDLFKYCNLAILFKGANDFGTGGTSITAPLFLDRMTLAKTKIQAAAPDISAFLICKTCPRTNSTDNWATELNQTPLTRWDTSAGNPLVYNTMLPATFDDVVDFDSIRGVVSVYNFLPNTAYDTTHINQAGQTLQAVNAMPKMQTYMLR
jgi:lysophospholipase L1-like esterase